MTPAAQTGYGGGGAEGGGAARSVAAREAVGSAGVGLDTGVATSGRGELPDSDGAPDGVGGHGTGRGQPARQAGRRQAGQRRRVLHLFAGPERDDSLAAAFRERGWDSDEVDVRRSSRQDLCRSGVYTSLLRRAEAGAWDLVVAGTPCSTFSVARFNDNGGAGRPLRRRSEGGRVLGLVAWEEWMLDEADLLVERTARLAEAVWRTGGDFVVENPIDRGEPQLASLGVYSEPDHHPLWLEQAMLTLERRTGARPIHFPQCALGGAFQKWTTLLCSPDAAARLEPSLGGLQCMHKSHEVVAAGYDALGRPTGPRAAAYPAGMHDVLAAALAGGGGTPRGEVAAEATGAVEGCGGAGVSAASRQPNFARWLASWDEAPALRRAMLDSSSAAGRFSLATLLAERRDVLRRLLYESAEADVTVSCERADWRERRGPVASAAPMFAARPSRIHPLAPVAVGHKAREPRRGYERVWVGRGGGSLLGNPFLLTGDARPKAARAAKSVRDAACDAYAAMLAEQPAGGTAARLAAGLAVDERHDDSVTAAEARSAAVRALAGRVREGGRLELACSCAPLRCHAEELALAVLEMAGWIDPGGNDATGSGAGDVDEQWRPHGGAAGLFWDPADFEAIKAWRAAAAEAWRQLAAGEDVCAPKDLHIPAERMRPQARALAPWVTGGRHEDAPVPVAQHTDGPPACGLRAHVFRRLAAGNDQEIAGELPWGFEDDSAGLDVYLAFHHPSCVLHREAAVAVLEKEGPDGKGWLCDGGDVPYLPLRAVPRGVVDQVHKKRVVTDHTYPFGLGISSNDGVGIDHLPDIKLSSGVKFARMVGILQSAGVGVLMWKRDAVAAYRQVPIHPRDLWKCGLVGGGGFRIDTRLSFGTRMAPNKFQRLMMVPVREAMRRIADFDAQHPSVVPEVVEWQHDRAKRLGDAQAGLAGIVQYIDDTLGVSVNDEVQATGRPRGEHHAEIFDAVMAEVGVEMDTGEKMVNSPDEVEALGIMVSAAEGCVYYPEGKKQRLRERIEAVLAAAAAGKHIPRTELESIAGKLKWVAHVAPSLQPKLTSAFAMLRAPGRPASLVASRKFVADQQAILDALDTLPRRPLVPRAEFPPIDDPTSRVMFQDASGDWGVGGFFVSGGTAVYFAAPYPEDIARAMAERRLSIGPTELAAELANVLLVLEREGSAARDLYLTNFTDNESARVAATKGTSSSHTMAPMAHALAEATVLAGAALRTLRVSTKENKVADGLSRGGDETALWAAAAAAQLEVERVAVPGVVWELLREAANPGP